MTKSVEGTAQRRELLGEIERLAEIAVFGTLSETYRTCGRAGCHCQGDGPNPHLNVSYRGENMKPKGYVGRCSVLKTLCRKTAGRKVGGFKTRRKGPD
jgi:hypothetical protein